MQIEFWDSHQPFHALLFITKGDKILLHAFDNTFTLLNTGIIIRSSSKGDMCRSCGGWRGGGRLRDHSFTVTRIEIAFAVSHLTVVTYTC